MFFFVLPLVAQFQGTWSGPYTEPDTEGHCEFFSTGTLTFTLAQARMKVYGDMKLDFATYECAAATPGDYDVDSLAGEASGSVLNASVFTFEDDGNLLSVPFVGTRTTNTTMTLTGPNGFTANLTRTSTTAPDTSGSGPSAGTYNATVQPADCNFGAPVAYAGRLSGSVKRTDNRIAAVLTAKNAAKLDRSASPNCTTVGGQDLSVGVLEAAFTAAPAISGSIIWDSITVPFTGTFSGGTLVGNGVSGGNSFNFTIRRTP